MKAPSIKPTWFLAGMLFYICLAACASNGLVNGRVVDAETQQPINGAAVAIRWYEDQPEAGSETTQTFDTAQDLSDKNGYFSIPDHPEKKFVMGVYKDGYICWSNRSCFTNDQNAAATRGNIRVEDGMLVLLEPLKAGHSRDQHAGFTVLVAEEVTASKHSPFYKAIKPLFKRWRDNLRRQFRKTFGRQEASQSN